VANRYYHILIRRKPYRDLLVFINSTSGRIVKVHNVDDNMRKPFLDSEMLAKISVSELCYKWYENLREAMTNDPAYALFDALGIQDD